MRLFSAFVRRRRLIVDQPCACSMKNRPKAAWFSNGHLAAAIIDRGGGETSV